MSTPFGADATVDIPPPRGRSRTTDECRSPTCIALMTGSGAELTGELENLLRGRLRLAAILLAVGFAVFLLRHFIQYEIAESTPFGLAMLTFHAMVTIALGAIATTLCRHCSLSLGYLRFCELTIFGLPVAFMLAMQYDIGLTFGREGLFMLEAGPWLMLIFLYALFIPNTLRRAVVVISAIAAVPILGMLVLRLISPDLGDAVTLERWTWQALMLACSAAASVFGVDTIGALRREAFEARQLGQYRLRTRIGAGGMGEVYLAEHQMLKRPCVIKLIRPDKAGDPKVLARFQREVQATARLTHWNTVEIFDYGNTADGTFYYVMEFLPGMSLNDLIERHGPLPPERVVYLLRQACDALREAHQEGLVHRDIKPGNIFAAEQGGVYDVVKLLDFGLVKPLTGDLSIELTAEGTITGSPLYMSPEQATAEHDADMRSDISSLGAVGYFLLTGRPPFVGERPIKVILAHAHQPVEPPSHHRPDVPADLERVILRCLAKLPEQRYQSAAELEAALADCESADGWSRQRAAQWWKGRATACDPAAVPA